MTASAQGQGDATSRLSRSQNTDLTSAGLSGWSRGVTNGSRRELGQHRPEGKVTELGAGRPGFASCLGPSRSAGPPAGPQFPVCGTMAGQRLTSSPALPQVCAAFPRPPGSGGFHLLLSKTSSWLQHVSTPQPSA